MDVVGIRDGQELPDAKSVSTGELAGVLRDLGQLAVELEAPIAGDAHVHQELRLAQYRRVVEVAEWLVVAADGLHYSLDREANPDEQMD